MRLDRSVAAPWLAVLFISSACAQVSAPQHLVQDWSSRHVVFTGLTPENVADRVQTDPRAWHSWVTHAGQRIGPALQVPRSTQTHVSPYRPQHRISTGDWQMPIVSGVGPRAFPAKFGFDVNAVPDCVNDYVVFPTSNSPAPGSSGAGVTASLIAYNNLYTGPGPTGICPTPLAPAAQPSALFAYNTSTTTSGKADLSPVISFDGQKIAFVESNDGSGSNYTAFHVLTWIAGEGTASAAAAPGNCSAGNSCMTTLVLSNTHSDSRSSPFVDYFHDSAYVGDDGGLLHKITPVFKGTPVEVIGSGWPVQLASAPDQVQSPVYDSASARIFVTDDSGNEVLYVVDAATGAILAKNSLGAISLSEPIVDSTNQTVFVFFADTSLNLTVAEFDTSGTILRQISVGTLGGNVTVFSGAFDNNYLLSPSLGRLYFAGEVNFRPSLYAVRFSGRLMNPLFSGPLVLGASTGIPTPLTEIFNPTLVGTPDRLFLGIDANCTNGNSDGCIESLDISNGFPSTILDSQPLATAGTQFSVSGVIGDNVSPAAQASSIYFESFTSSPPASAIKLTQSGLQ